MSTMSESNNQSASQAGESPDDTNEKLKAFLSKFVPYDPRFPNQNQTRNCHQNYVDYFRCLKKTNGDEEYCAWYQSAYKQLCFPEWIEKWDEQRENKTFPVRDIL